MNKLYCAEDNFQRAQNKRRKRYWDKIAAYWGNKVIKESFRRPKVHNRFYV